MIIRATTYIRQRRKWIEVYIADLGDTIYPSIIVVVDKNGKEIMTIDMEKTEHETRYYFDVERIEYNRDIGICKLVVR